MLTKFKRIISAALSAVMIASSSGNIFISPAYAEPTEEINAETQSVTEDNVSTGSDNGAELFEIPEIDDQYKADLSVEVLGIYNDTTSTDSHYNDPTKVDESSKWHYFGITPGETTEEQFINYEEYTAEMEQKFKAAWIAMGSPEIVPQNASAKTAWEGAGSPTLEIPEYDPAGYTLAYWDLKRGKYSYNDTGEGTYILIPALTTPTTAGNKVSSLYEALHNVPSGTDDAKDPEPTSGFTDLITDPKVGPGDIHVGDIVYLGVKLENVDNTKNNPKNPDSGQVYRAFRNPIQVFSMAMYYDSEYLSIINQGGLDKIKAECGNTLDTVAGIQLMNSLTTKTGGTFVDSNATRLSSSYLWGSSYAISTSDSSINGNDDYFTSLNAIPSSSMVKPGEQKDSFKPVTEDFGNKSTVAKITVNYSQNTALTSGNLYPKYLTDNGGSNYLAIIPFYVKKEIPKDKLVTQLALEADNFSINSFDNESMANIQQDDALGAGYVAANRGFGEGDSATAAKWYYQNPYLSEVLIQQNMETFVNFHGDPILNPTQEEVETPPPAKPILTVTGENVTIKKADGTAVPVKTSDDTTKTYTYELETGKVYTATVTAFDDGKKFSAWTIGASGDGGASNIALETGSTTASNPINFKISGNETLTYATADKTRPSAYIGSEGTTTASYNRQTGTGGVTVTLKGGDYTYNNKVTLDGAEVAATNYTYNSTANTVTFSDAYLKSLPIDTAKTFTFEFTGDTAVTNPTVTITLSDTSTYLNEVQIDNQPVLTYTHGDKLDLTGLEFKVANGQFGYDTEKQFKYDGTQWVSDTTYSGSPYDDVTITLNDGGTGTAVTAGNEKGQITVRRDTHNGKKITITPKDKSGLGTDKETTFPNGVSLFAATDWAAKSADTSALTVNQKALPVTAAVSSAVSQDYAGTVSGNVAFNAANAAKVTVTPDSTALVGSDSVTASASAPAFKGFHAGTYSGDTGIDLGTVSLGGTHAANYTLGTVTNSVTGTIAAKTVTVTIKNENIPSKVAGTVTKDGTYAITGTPTIEGIVAADSAKVSVVGTGTSDAWVYSYVANTSHTALTADPAGGQNYTAKVGAKLKFADNAYQNDYVLSATDGVYYSADDAAVVTARTITDITATAQSKTFTHDDPIDTSKGVKDAAFKVTWSDDSYTTYKYGASGWEIDTANSDYTATSFADSGVTVSWKKGSTEITGTPKADYGSTYSYNATAASKTVALVNYTVDKKDIYVKLAKAAADTDLNKVYDGDNNVAAGKVVAKVYSDAAFENELTGVTVNLTNVQYKKTGSEPADKDAGANKNITATATAANNGYNIANTVAALTGAEITQMAITISSVTNVPTADQNKAATADEKKTGSGSVTGVGSETVYYEYEVTYTTADLAGNVNSTPTLNVTNGVNGYTAVATPAGKPTNTGYVPANYTLTGPATVTGKIANPGVGTPKSLKITTLPTLAKTYGDNGVSLENMKVTRTLYGANSADGDVEVYEYKSGSWTKKVNSGAASNVSDVPFTVELVKDGSASKAVTDVVTLDHAGYAVKAADKNYTELTDKGGSITVGKKALTLNITYTGVEKTYDGNGTIGTVADILGTGITGSATFAQGSDTLTAASGKVTLKGAADVVTVGQTENVEIDLSKITATVTAGSGSNNYEKYGVGSKGITTPSSYTLTGDLANKYTVTLSGTGNITINKMALTVKAVTGIPSITLGDDISAKVPNQSASLAGGTNIAKIEVNETPVSGEALTFTYSYKYSKNTPKGSDDNVAITDVAMVSATRVNANYTISGDATAKGTINGQAITTLEISKTKKEYVHGEQLGDLSDLTITANGKNYTLEQWKDMGGTVTIAGIDNGSEAYPAATTVMRYDNKSATGGAGGAPKNLLLTVTAPSELTTMSLFANVTKTLNLKVARRPVSMSAALKDSNQKVTKEFNNDVDVPSTEYSKISYTLGAVSGKTESGVLSGDTVTLSATPAYDNKNVANGTKTITFSSPGLSGTNSDCYAMEGTTISSIANAGTITARPVKLTVTLPTTVYEGEADTYNNIGNTAAANGAKWTASYNGSVAGQTTAFYGTDGDNYKVNAKYASTATASNSVSVTCSVAAQLNSNYDVTTDSPITGKVTENGFTISVDNPKTETLSHGDVITESYNADTAVKLTWTNTKVTIYKYESGSWVLDVANSSYKLSYDDAVANKGLSIAFRAADSVTPGTTTAAYGKTYIVQASATGVDAKDVLTYTVKQKEVYVKAVKKANDTKIEKIYNGNNTYDNTSGNITLSLTTDAAGNTPYTGTTIASSAITFVKTGDDYAIADKDAGAKKMHITATVDANHKIVGYINNDDSATPITGTIKQKEITVNPTIPSTAKNTKATADKVVNGSGTYTDPVTSETVSYTFDATYPLSYVKSGTTPVPNVPISNYAIADATNNNNYKIVSPDKGEGTIAGVADGSVTGISITKMPDDSDYEYGDALNLTGMQITAKIQGMSDAVYTYGDGKWKDAGGSEVTGIDVKIKKGSNADTAIPGQLTLNNNGSNLRAFYDGFDATSAGTITVGKKQITLTINYPDGMEKLYNKSTVFKTIDKITGTTFDVNGTAATVNASNVIEITGAFTGEKISVDTTRITANTLSANANNAVSLADLTTGESTITYAPGTDKDNYNVTIAQNNKTVKINPYPITITVGDGAVPAITLGATKLDTDVTGASVSGTGAQKITVAKTNSTDPAIPDTGFTVNYKYTYSASGPTTSTAVTVTASGQTLTAPTPVTNYDVTWAQNLTGSIAAKDAAAADFGLVKPTKTDYIHGQNFDPDGLKVTYGGKAYVYSTDTESEWVKNGNKLYLVDGSNETEITDANKTMQLRYDGTYAANESGNTKKITFKVKVPKDIKVLPTTSLFSFAPDGTYYSETFTVDISKRTIEAVIADYADGVTSIDKEYNNSADADINKAVLTAANAENDTTNVITGDTVTLTATAKYQDGDTPADTDKNASTTAKKVVFSGVKVKDKADGNNNDCYVVNATPDNLSGMINKRPIKIVVNTLPAAYKLTENNTNVEYDITDYTAKHKDSESEAAFMPATDASVYTYKATYADLSTDGVSTGVTYAIKNCTDTTIGNNYDISFDGPDTVAVQAGKINSLGIAATTTGHTHGDDTKNANIVVTVGYVGGNQEVYVCGQQTGDTATTWYLRTGSEGSYTYEKKSVASIFSATWEGTTDVLTTQLSNKHNGKKLQIKPTDTTITGVSAETAAFTIAQKEVTVTLSGTPTKVYDKTTDMAMTDGKWNGVTAALTGADLIPGENVTVDNTSNTKVQFAQADVHTTAMALTHSITTSDLTGTGHEYYKIADGGVTNNATGTITAKPIDVTISGSATKTYDGTATVADITSLTVNSAGIISGDDVDFNAGSEFEFADEDGHATANASSAESWATQPAAKVRAKDGDKTKVSLNNSNYSINAINAGGTGTINQFGITVTGISNIPSVALGGSTNKVTGNKATSGTTDETYKSQLTITETIPNSEVITATYSYQYTDTHISGSTTPTISEVALDTNILKQNYTLTSNVSGQTGEIDPEDIEGIAIVNTSNYAYTKDYIHGQTLTTDDIYIVVNGDNDHRKYTAAQWLTIGGKLEFAGISDNNTTLPTGKTVRFDNTQAGTEASGKKPITITATAPDGNKLTQLFSILFEGEKTATATINVSRKQLTAVTPTKSSDINREYDGTTTADKSNITFALNDSDIVVKTAPSTKDEVSINKDAVTADYFDGTNKVSGASDTVRAITFGKADTADTILTGTDADCYIAPAINNLENAGKITKRRLLLTVTNVPSVSVGTTDAGLVKDATFTAAHRSDNATSIVGAVADTTGVTTDTSDAFIGNDQNDYKVKATYANAAAVNTTGVDVAISLDPATSDNYELTVLNKATGKITSFEIANVELLSELTKDELAHGTELPDVPSNTKIRVTWADSKYTVYRYDTSTDTHEWLVETGESDRPEVVFSQSGLAEVIKINAEDGTGAAPAANNKANYHDNDTDSNTYTYNYLIQYDKKSGENTAAAYLTYAQYNVTKKALTLTMSKNGAGDDVINKTYDGDADYKNAVATDDTDTDKILVGLTGVESVVNDPAKDNVSIDTSKLKLAYKEKTERTGLGDKDAGQKNIVFANANIDEILTGDDADCYTITDKTASVIAEIKTKELTVTSTAENPIAATVQYKQNASDTYKETTATITGVNSESITYKYTVVYRGTDISDESKKDQAIKVDLDSGVYEGKDYAITSNSPVDANNYTLAFGDIYGKITSYIVTKYVVKSMPSDVDYVYGDTVDLTGMTVEEVIEDQPSNIYTYGTFNGDTTPGWYQVTGETGSEVYQSVTAPFTVGVNNKGTDKDITAALDVDDNSSLTVANGEISVEWTGLTNIITVGKKTLTLLFKDYPSTLPSKTYDGETKFGNIAALGVTYYQGDTQLTASGDNLYMTGANSTPVGVDLTKLIVTANNKNANADDDNNLIANEDRHIVSINTENALSDANKANYNFELKYDNGTEQITDFSGLKLQINKMLVNVTLTNYPKAVVGQTPTQGTGVMANQTGKVGEQDTTGGKIAVAPATAPPSMPEADKDNFVMTYDYDYAQMLEVPTPNAITPTIKNEKFTDDNNISKNFKLNLIPLSTSEVDPQPVEIATAAINKDYIHGESFDLAHNLTATINGMTYNYDTADGSLWVKNGITVQIKKGENDFIALPADDTVRYDAEYAKAVTGQEYKEVTFHVIFPTNLNAVPNPASSASMMQLFAEPKYADVTVKVSKRPISVTAALNAAADGLTDGLIVREYNSTADATNGTAEGEARITLTPEAVSATEARGVLAADTVTLKFTQSRYTETKEGVETDSPNASDLLKNITVDGIAPAAKAADNNNDCYTLDNTTALIANSGRIDKRNVYIDVTDVPSISIGEPNLTRELNTNHYTAYHGTADNHNNNTEPAFYGNDVTKYTFTITYSQNTPANDVTDVNDRTAVTIDAVTQADTNYNVTIGGDVKGLVTPYELAGYVIDNMPDGYDSLTHGDKLPLNGMIVHELLTDSSTGSTFKYGKFDANGDPDASAQEGWYEKGKYTQTFALLTSDPFNVTLTSGGSFDAIKKSNDNESQIRVEKDNKSGVSDKKLSVKAKDIKINVIYPQGLEKTYNASAVFSTIDKISGVKLEKDAPQPTLAPGATSLPESTLAPAATTQPIGETVEFDGVNGEKIIINTTILKAVADSADAGARTITTDSNGAYSFSNGVDSNDYNIIIEGSAALTINKMKVNIEITNIPNAVVGQAPATGTVNAKEVDDDFTVTPAVDGESIPTGDSGNFAMSYTYTYEFNTSTDQKPTITITNPTLAAAYDNNYEIVDCTAEADGTDKIDPGTTDEEHVSVNKVKKDYIHGETLSLDDLTVEINGLTYTYGSDEWKKNKIEVALVNNDDTSATPKVDGKTLRYDGAYAGTAAAGGKKPMTLNVTIQKAVHAVPTMAPGAVNLLDVTSTAIVLPVNMTIDKKTITSVTAELTNNALSIDKEYDGTPTADKTNIAFIPNADDIIANDKAVVTADANYTVDDIDSKDASESKKDISFVNAVLAAKANDNNNDCYKLADNLVIAKLNESGIISPRKIVVKAILPTTSVETGSEGTYTITNYTAEHKDDPTGMAFTAEDSNKFTFKATYDTSAEAEVPVTYSYEPDDDTNYSIEIQGPSTIKVEDNIPVITNIEVIGKTNTDVTNGDELDLTGITVKVTYSNDTVEEYVFTNPEDETQPAGWYLNGTPAESIPFNTNWNDEDKTQTGTYFPYDQNGNEIVVTPADPTIPGGGNIGPFNISPKTIDVTLSGNVSKVYDKTSAVTSWSGIEVSFDGVVGNDAVEIDKTTSSLKYINKATGEDAIDVALADGIGVVAVNLTNPGYIANVIDNTKAQITPATINFTKIVVPSKTKGAKVDVSASAVVNAAVNDKASNRFEATGIYEGDTVTISYSGEFASTSSVAKDIAVTINQLTIDGDERSVTNYVVGTIPAVTADVTSGGGGGGGGGGTSNSLTIKIITPEGKVVTITKHLTAPALSDPVNLTAIFEKKLTDSTVIWKSEDESIVKVDENGVVSFIKVGETKVTATSKSNPNLTNVVEIVVTEALLKPTPVPTEIPHETVIKSVLNPYIIGYDDNVFGPELPISREEVATIFARLIANNIYMDESYTTRFWDVSDEDWSRDYIGYLETFDIIHGYDDGSFMPKSYITRAEMAVMMARAEGYDIEGYMAADEMDYPDIPEEYGTWATKAIDILTTAGVMEGYEDGTFRPTQPITRAETVATVNRVLKNMEVDVIEVRPSDMTDAHWAYDNVIFAMNHRILKDVAADANTFVWSEEFDKNITTKEEVVINGSNGENISPEDSVIVPEATAQPRAD